MENNTELNQELIENLELENENGKDIFLLASKSACKKSYLHKILNINPKSWYDLEDKGILPPNGTYEEYLRLLFKHYQLKGEVALEKAKLKASKDTESGMSLIMEASIRQRIKLDIARERGIHIANLKEQKEILDRKELLELISPILGNIATVLRNAADTEPTLQPVIDKCFESLYTTGKKISEQCNVDSDNYVKHMLEREIDINAILDI